MSRENTGDRGKRGRGKGTGGSKRAKKPTIDWAELRAQVLRELYGGRLPPNDTAADAVQSVIAELYEAYRRGDDPRTQEALQAVAVRRVRNRRTYWARREREHAAKAAAHAQELTARDLFEIICVRDEQQKLYELMLKAFPLDKEPEARMVLVAICHMDIGDPERLAKVAFVSVPRVKNIIRRLARKAATLSAKLNSSNGAGGSK
jgi:hypothetical protein